MKNENVISKLIQAVSNGHDLYSKSEVLRMLADANEEIASTMVKMPAPFYFNDIEILDVTLDEQGEKVVDPWEYYFVRKDKVNATELINWGEVMQHVRDAAKEAVDTVIDDEFTLADGNVEIELGITPQNEISVEIDMRPIKRDLISEIVEQVEVELGLTDNN